MFPQYARNASMYCARLLTATQQHSPILKIPIRCLTHNPTKFQEVENKWREKDGVSKNYELIYKAPMEGILKFAALYLTFSTTTVGLAGIYYAAFEYDMVGVDKPIVLGDDVVIANSGAECLTYIGAFVLFHVAVKVLLSKYVIRLYQNNDSYIAVFRGHLYNSITKHKFILKEFKKLSPTFVVSWGESRYGLGDKHGILLDNYFKSPQYLNYLLYKKKPESDTETPSENDVSVN